jgi:hypothetical protein
MADLKSLYDAIGATKRKFDSQIREVKGDRTLTPEAIREKTQALDAEKRKAHRAAVDAYEAAKDDTRSTLRKRAFGPGSRLGASTGDEQIVRTAHRQAAAEAEAAKSPKDIEALIKRAHRSGDSNALRGVLGVAAERGHYDLVREYGDDNAKELIEFESDHGELMDGQTRAVRAMGW